MKKIFLVTILIPTISFAQYVPSNNNYNVNVNVKKEKSVVETVNDSRKASAAESQAQAARAAAMSEVADNVKVPIEVDLNDYTHIALVSVIYAFPNGTRTGFKKANYMDLKKNLINSPLTIINPYEFDKRQAKKDPRFLRGIKDPKWLYVYYDRAIQGVDDIRTLVIRDSNNKIIFHRVGRNISFSEILSPIVYF